LGLRYRTKRGDRTSSAINKKTFAKKANVFQAEIMTLRKFF
jgi:hypothetical protein